jgi:hypothetical protein
MREINDRSEAESRVVSGEGGSSMERHGRVQTPRVETPERAVQLICRRRGHEALINPFHKIKKHPPKAVKGGKGGNSRNNFHLSKPNRVRNAESPIRVPFNLSVGDEACRAVTE